MPTRPKDRKQQIVAQASILFSKCGFEKITVKDLAEACGITEPALYRHFRSKNAIYDAVLDSIATNFEQQVLFDHLQGEEDLTILLKGIAEHILTFVNTHREPYRLLLYSTLGHHAKARKVFRSIRLPYVEFLRENLDQFLNKGLIRKKDNEITARCFVGMIFDCALCTTLWQNYQGRKCEPKELIANNIPIFTSGLLLPRTAT